jgi:hypothetical protein
MPDPAGAIAIGLEAGEWARRRLRERGIDPSKCEHLVHALETGVAGLIASRELNWPVAPRDRYVKEVQRRLEVEPLADHPPEPTKRYSRRLLEELNAARRPRGG